MSFLSIIKKYEKIDIEKVLNQKRPSDIKSALSKDALTANDLLSLISPAADSYLEDIAQKAHRLTLSNFGKAIQLYTPIYISNYCDNRCIYCGFNVDNKQERKKLNSSEIEKEAKYIASTGLRHILILTGDSRRYSPLSYIKDVIKILKKYFDSISIEIYPLTEKEYVSLIEEGIDGLTIYQETYNREVYDTVHVSGPKKDYTLRLDAPERALLKGMRTVNIGALLGLSKWQEDGFLTGLHAEYLQNKFPSAEISISLPRIRPQTEDYRPEHQVDDKDITKLILAFRLFLPRVGITISTRENAALRENLLPLGVTKMSAESTTAVGGHTFNDKNLEQFAISDKRTVSEIRELLLRKGYQPVSKDWMCV